MLKLEYNIDNKQDKLIGFMFYDIERKLRVLIRADYTGLLDGFSFAWKHEENREVMYDWDRGSPDRLTEVRYVFDGQQSVTIPIDKVPPFEWFVEILNEENSDIPDELIKQILEVLLRSTGEDF